MSLARTILVTLQAAAHHAALTPPNPTIPQERYHTKEASVLQIAPFIFKMQTVLSWYVQLSSSYRTSALPISPSSPNVCPASSQPHMHLTTLATIGAFAAYCGCLIRIICFRELGSLFTFDLTIRPEHKLITTSFYGWVRHPAYSGSMLLVVGLAFSHLSHGSWLNECALNSLGPWTGRLVWIAWWAWTLSVGLSRAQAEDSELRKTFGEQWEAYAADVSSWFLPGLF